MRRQFPHFDWLTFFNTIFEDIVDKNGKTITFDDNAEVVIYGVDFVQRLDALIPTFDKKYANSNDERFILNLLLFFTELL